MTETAGFVMATLGGATGAIQTSESLTFVPPKLPTAWTVLAPATSDSGHVKILLALVCEPCEAPFINTRARAVLSDTHRTLRICRMKIIRPRTDAIERTRVPSVILVEGDQLRP